MHLIKDENGNVISHGHGEEHMHSHEHTHEDGHVHVHEHCHEGEHAHSHTDCQHCKGEDGCTDETVALLTYMVQHNEHHAMELDQMADNLIKLGMEDAAKTIKEGVADFQKANMRFSLALTQVKEHTKEA